MIFRILFAALLLVASFATAQAQFSEQSSYVVGTGTANAQAASFPNATTIADIVGVPLRVQAGATNTAAATLTVNSFSAQNILKPVGNGLGALTGGEIQSGQVFMVVWDGTQFELISSINNATVNQGCQFYNLLITNDGSGVNTNIGITFDGATLIVPTSRVGAFVTIASPPIVINTTTGTGTSAANGMDGEARGNNNFVSVWVIYNGTTVAGLGSLAVPPTLPTMPAGYTYACFAGFMKTNGAGNLYGTLQRGNETRYVNGGNGLTTLPILLSGAGTSSGCTTTTPTWEQFTVRANTGAFPLALFPPTAELVTFSGFSFGGTQYIAPNSTYGGTAANSPLPSPFAPVLLESNNIQVCQTSAAVINAYGWKERVNAN
jgi:hypothetical protein